MKIFVAGATGAIGCPLITQLLTKGYDVTALTRSPEKAQKLTAQGVDAAIADASDPDAVQAILRQVQPDVVIEQLTSLPTHYTPETMQTAAPQNNRIRLEGGAKAIAFLMVLERLSRIERAVREVFEYDYDQFAQMVGKSPANLQLRGVVDVPFVAEQIVL